MTLPDGKVLGGPEPLSGVLTGPWDQAFWLEVPVEMRSKSNFRRYKGQSSRSSWQAFSSFEASLSTLVRRAIPDDWDLGDASAALPSRPTVVAFVFAHSVLDAANLSKSVLDACEDLVFHNDASVRYCGSLGLRTRKEVGGLIAFARLPSNAGPRSLLEAAWSLEAASLEVLEGSWSRSDS